MKKTETKCYQIVVTFFNTVVDKEDALSYTIFAKSITDAIKAAEEETGEEFLIEVVSAQLNETTVPLVAKESK